ncbi:P-loop containing nucleoside triphosphate hydrolase [Pseudocohnilembus persalinus]|uniref:p-loop containing nucleoside triphosphate hydrolase n=1 Tax=Pseudocohnilembus persalinus TaxID=266149 RepID=A0A0V0R7D7_PSEPJ|nr:P-loop containing nucleoside triphosphate hydrolase [Pseudocohnilembus persalinus]|eukprot:KRX10429.1 P-loop containing nucleoside triphosphate hydrolase [Pseudocohnilembus persalinus]
MNRSQNSKIVVIEGNIGSGKSTLLKLIREKMTHIQTIKEPVNQWQAIGGNKDLNLLDAFYKDPKRMAYTFQSYAYYSRIKNWSEMEISADVAIAERSVLSDRHIFAMNAKKSGLFSELEWELYSDYFNWLVKQFQADKINGIIYIETDPKICQQRINKRGRDEEKDTIPLEYLQSVHDRHVEWLKDENLEYPILIIDGSQNYDSNIEIQQKLVDQIQEFVDKLEDYQTILTNQFKQKIQIQKEKNEQQYNSCQKQKINNNNNSIKKYNSQTTASSKKSQSDETISNNSMDGQCDNDINQFYNDNNNDKRKSSFVFDN